MSIGGFTLGKKQFIVIGVIVGLVGLVVLSSMAKEKKLKDEAIAEAKRVEAQRAEEAKKAQEGATTDEQPSMEDLLQQNLIKTYGVAPEGFEWDQNGELVALGSENMTADDVIYTYVRALSMLDFSTAQRYASKSNVCDTYSGYYDIASQVQTDYYDNFLRKQYKKCLTSVEVNEVKDTAIFANGSQIVTLGISSLDLTDKDFWVKDQQELYDAMELYNETESDSVKMESYLYDYIYNCYLDGTIKKKEYNIEIVISKDNSGGWLVSDDAELDAVLGYESGVDVATHIINSYTKWHIEKVQQELLAEQTQYE